ncbi:MAG: Zn-dependent hydrolase [Bacteroidales bacterium]|nr:Zn-dependent hydrolase [Bacteroidales bacterium]
MKKLMTSAMILSLMALVGCNGKKPAKEMSEIEKKVSEYAEYTLSSDLVAQLSDNEKKLLPVLIEIAEVMDDLFWEQNFGTENRAALDTISDPAVKAFALIHYGAWDGLDENKPFLPGYGAKPQGATFYPEDMSKEEFAALDDAEKTSQYTVIRRDENGALKVVPYHVEYAAQLAKVDSLLGVAIELADNEGLKNYLTKRREAFKTDDYYESDLAWMDMKDSKIDFVVGPIENYTDELFGYKTAYESFILLKDEEWSNRLAKFTSMLPEMQTLLPVEDAYKPKLEDAASDLNVYDVVYYAGDCNAASKTIAINLPNDERIHAKKGTRRLQLKNAMKAKYDMIMMPIAELMINKEQLDNVTFNAFFSNVCYHEVAHGLGVKQTVNTKESLRKALKEQYSAWEEAKADICGLFLTKQLIDKGEITDVTVEDIYVTYVAGILRSVRFGAGEAHGVANMMCFNFMQDKGAFTRDAEGKYVIDIEKTTEAMNEWAALILKVEGDGAYDYAKEYAGERGKVRSDLQADLDKIAAAGIPRDITYNQGLEALGLK